MLSPQQPSVALQTGKAMHHPSSSIFLSHLWRQAAHSDALRGRPRVAHIHDGGGCRPRARACAEHQRSSQGKGRLRGAAVARGSRGSRFRLSQAPAACAACSGCPGAAICAGCGIAHHLHSIWGNLQGRSQCCLEALQHAVWAHRC